MTFLNQVPEARRQDCAQSWATAPQSWKEAAESRSEGNQEETETGEAGAAVERTLHLGQSQPDKHGLGVHTGPRFASSGCLRNSLRSSHSPRPHPSHGPWPPGLQSRVSASSEGRQTVLGPFNPAGIQKVFLGFFVFFFFFQENKSKYDIFVI